MTKRCFHETEDIFLDEIAADDEKWSIKEESKLASRAENKEQELEIKYFWIQTL